MHTFPKRNESTNLTRTLSGFRKISTPKQGIGTSASVKGRRRSPSLTREEVNTTSHDTTAYASPLPLLAPFSIAAPARALFFPRLLIAASLPPLLIEYQTKCNYGWNSCFVGANNLPWRIRNTYTHIRTRTRGVEMVTRER